jgi:hypothetical protein
VEPVIGPRFARTRWLLAMTRWLFDNRIRNYSWRWSVLSRERKIRRGYQIPATAKTGTAEELARRIKEGAIPIISDVEGFKAYYVVYAGDDTVTAISLFNNFAGAEEANKRALAWIEQELSPLLAGPASAVAGPVIVHTLA